MLEQVRPAVKRWLDAVDRIPAGRTARSRSLERDRLCLRASADRAGARRGKTSRRCAALVRRIQNSGYATMPRVAEHLMSLTGGDESNAVVEALDSVNLMTVHAAKGSSFPIVFLVNLAKGASGPPQAGPGDLGRSHSEEPSVSVGPFISDTDEAERERERHETRRLLYVAVTRARDRLVPVVHARRRARSCLAAAVLPRCSPSRAGSCSRPAPRTFSSNWTPSAGPGSRGVNTPGVCVASTATTADTRPADASAQATGTAAGRLRITPRRRRLVTESRRLIWSQAGTADVGLTQGSRSDRLLGIVIHRMFEHARSR